MSVDERAFRDFEAAGWNEVADGYASSDVVGALARAAATHLVRAVGAGPGTRILDLACGPGDASREARSRGAEVVGVDIADAMVAVAAQRVPDAEFRVGAAEEIPFPAASFDGVVCGFGLPHFSAPEAVLREVHRVLRPGGRMAFTTWCAPDRVPFFGIVFTAVAEHGSLDVALPEGPDMFRFADGVEATRTLAALGFVEAEVETLPLEASVEHPGQAIDLVTRATVRTRALLEAQTPAAREAIARHVAEAVEQHRAADGSFTVAMPAVLLSAVRP